MLAPITLNISNGGGGQHGRGLWAWCWSFLCWLHGPHGLPRCSLYLRTSFMCPATRARAAPEGSTRTGCAAPPRILDLFNGWVFLGFSKGRIASRKSLSRRRKSLKAWSSRGPFCGVATLRKGCVSASRSFGNASPDPHPRRMTPLTMHPPALPSCRCRRVRELSTLRRPARSHLRRARPWCERAAIRMCM